MRTVEEEEAAIRADPRQMRLVVECLIRTPGNDATDFLLELHRVAMTQGRSRADLALFSEAFASRVEEHIKEHAKAAHFLATQRALINTPAASPARN